MFDRMIRFSQSIQIKRAYLKALILFLTLFDIDMMDGSFPKSDINFGNHQDLIIDCLYYNLIIETNSEQPKDLDGVLDQKDSCSTLYLVFLYTFEQHFEENKFVTVLVSFFYRFKKMLSLNILNIQKMETILLRQINMNCHQMIGKRNKNTQQRQKLTSTEEIRKSQQNIDYISHNQDCNYKPMDEAPTTLCENIKNGLVKLRQKLNEIIGYRFEDICKLCKKISKQLTNWLRYYPTIKSNSQLDQIFDDCIGNLNILVRSTSVSTSNFPFPYFGFILKKAFKKINKLISCNQITINLRVQKNEQSFNKNTIDIKPIEKGQLNFLKSENVNQTIQQITKNQIILPNNQCALCSQVFVQGFQIFNHNPLFPVVLGLTQKQGFDKIQMYKYLCSVSNMGGGLIIIGVQRRKNSVYATGINVKDENSMHEKIKQIRQVASSHIRPQFYFDVSVVRVHSNFFDRQNLYQEKNRYCLKIIIYLAQSNFASFVEISNKGFHSLYQSYVLDGHKSRRILPESNNFSFYKYMLKKYKHIKENPANCHQGIKCTYPYNFYSKKFQMYWNSLTEEQIYSLEYTPQVEEPIVQESDELKFKYTYNSILAVGSKNKDRYVRDFEDYANSKKLNIELFKPFSKYFKEGQRSIWMLSHTDKHQVIKSVIKQIDKQGNITFIPVYKTLQIDRSKINQQYYDYIQKSFMQKYPEGFKIQSKLVTYQGKQREVLFFDFNCYPHAIFGYLIFQSLQLKPYFVKPNTEYKKKTGKKW